MGLRLRVKYFDANDSELTPVDVEGVYSDKWKRLSTLGHPGTSRPVGVEQLADLHNSLDWSAIEPVDGIRSLALTEKINADTIEAGEISAGTLYYHALDPGVYYDCPFSILEGKIVQGQSSYSYVSADTVHLNVPTGPANQSPLDVASNGIYCSLPEYIVSLKYSQSYNQYYLLCFKGSASPGSVAPEIYIKEIPPISSDSSLYEESSKFYGYGESNLLYGVFDPQNYQSQGWVAVEDPQIAQYFVSPQYVALPESNDGILLINSTGQYIDEAYIWDPLFGDTTQLVVDQDLRQQLDWSRSAQGYCGVPSDYAYIPSAYMFAVTEGITLKRYRTALYVGDELFYSSSGANYSPSDDHLSHAGKPFDNGSLRHAEINFRGGQRRFYLPSIAAIGTPTFLSLGDGYYIGSNQFSPFRQVFDSRNNAGEIVFASGYTILHAPFIDNESDFELGSVIVEEDITPPTGAVKMQEFIELY